MAPPAVTPGEAPSTAISARLELGATGCALVGGFLAAAAGPLVTFGVLGALLGIGLLAAAAYRPVFATYAYLATLPIVVGIDRGELLPLVRPNEALLALLLTGAILGGYLRYRRGATVPFRLHRLDALLVVFVLLATAWPLMVRGQLPAITDVVAVLPIVTLLAVYLLVRFTVGTEAHLLCCLRLIVWPGAVIAIVQMLQLGPVPAFPIATGGYLMICLVLVLCCGAYGLLHRRERLVLGLALATGVLATGQVLTWIAAAVAGALILGRFPELRPAAVRLLWFVPVAVAVGALARIGGPESFADLGLWDNLSNVHIPEFGLLWIGGPALLAAFGWLSVAVLRRTRERVGQPGALGATAAALQVCLWFLLVLVVLDPHLTLRATGDLLLIMLAITAGRLPVKHEPVEPAPGDRLGTSSPL
ncbi:MAG: hypothetical protein GEU83_02365 [Pseudonocardiaceae bacterium]|nr:hypothetical protein [Pseudonocardiaceae bacterium]